MGGMQSKNHKNESDTDLFLDLETSENNSTLRRCSTSISPFYPLSSAIAATQLGPTGKQTISRRKCLCLKYDPVYVLWKNGFENTELRTPRKVPPISGKNKRVYDITGVIAGQQTPQGFPYFTIYRKKLHHEEEDSDDEELVPYDENCSRRPLIDPPSTLNVPETVTKKEKEICPINNLQTNFVSNTPEEQPRIIKNLLVEIKQKISERATATNETSITLKKPTKRLYGKNFRKRLFIWETKVQQRKIIDLHDLGGCYYAF